jgi:glycosyltransferase involved in cell wall biosynthesis
MKISVVTVCYNSSKTIRDTIESVIDQTYDDIEYIVVDGKSSDNTLDIINEYRAHIARVISEPDHGIYDAMNKGIRHSTGDIVCILNSDDVFHKANTLTSVIDEFEKHPQIDSLLTDIKFWNFEAIKRGELRYVSSAWFSPWKLRLGWMPPHPGMFLKSKVYKDFGLYKLSYKIAADYEYMVRIFFNGKVSFIKKDICTVLMREGGASTSGISSTHTITREIVKACVDNDIYTNYFLVSLRLPIKWFIKIALGGRPRKNALD